MFWFQFDRHSGALMQHHHGVNGWENIAMSCTDPQALLFDALFIGDKVKVKQLISSGIDKNTVYHNPARWEGATVLGTAAYEGHIDIVQYLIEEGTPVNFRDPCTSRSALHWAIMGDQYQVTKFLLKCGADVNSPDKDSVTPLLRATIGRNCDLVKLLIDSGANVNCKDRIQCSALHYACVHNDPKLVSIIIKGGCIQNNKCIIGKGTPLATLADKNDLQSMRLLLEAGYDVLNDVWIKQYITSSHSGVSDVDSLLQRWYTNPSHLQICCRNVIRRQLAGQNIRKKIESLNLPSVIKSYLLMEN